MMFGLRKEVEKLREEVRELRDAAQIRRYGARGGSFSLFCYIPPPSATMSAAEAIERIAAHVGLQFDYSDGSPKAVTLGKAPALAKKK